jgi:hypothetical protein
MVCERIVAGAASEIVPTAFEFNSDDIERAVVMHTATLWIQLKAVHLYVVNGPLIVQKSSLNRRL